MVANQGDGFELGADFEFGQGRAELSAHGGHGHDEVLGDGGGALALGEQVEHLAFAGAEPFE